MKKKHAFRFTLIALLALTVVITSTSCKKSKVRKDIAGTWTLTEATINGDAYPGTVEATIVFNDCSNKQNKNAECTADQTFTITQSGQTQTETVAIPYQILKKGETMQYDDTVVDIDINGDNLTMTFNEAGDVVIWKLTRQ